ATSPDDLAAAAASEVIALLDSAIAWRGEAHLALSGGRTPAALHRVLASTPFEGWPFVHVWFGDERTVPPDHADSNYLMARETLLDLVPIPAAQVHRLAGEDEPGAAAAAYHEALAALARDQEREAPTFDVLLLGMGADAHTASLFPGSPLLATDAPDTFATAVDVPKLSTTRLTVTPATIKAARAVLVLVAGADKHDALTRALGADPPLADAPVTLLRDVPGDVAWYVDRAALFGV
ncbi:MAG TPA: 6-phosphogluconolactonase, partial [Luteitalea sp.]|nr:6-phosphogluconolactonase [Luteitalea sp.]